MRRRSVLCWVFRVFYILIKLSGLSCNVDNDDG